MAFPKFDSKTFRTAALGLTGAVAAAAMVVGPSAAEDRKVDPAPSFLAAEIEHAAGNQAEFTPVVADTIQYPEMAPLEAIEFSRGRVVLYAGRDLFGLSGVEAYLNEVGRPASIVYYNGADGPLKVEDNEFAVFANGDFGGIYEQTHINNGIGADIELFARDNGVPLQQAALNNDNLTAGLN